HARAHARTGADVITGPVLARGERMRPLGALSCLERQQIRSGKATLLNIDAQYHPCFAPGCNASYRRKLLRELGGFDENFVGSAVGEDAEMCHRVKLSGGTITYDPAASIVHLQVATGGCRDEADELRRAITNVSNAHYFLHKIGRSDLVALEIFSS